MPKAIELAERAAELLPAERALSRRGRLALGSALAASSAACDASAAAKRTWRCSAAGGSPSQSLATMFCQKMAARQIQRLSSSTVSASARCSPP
eukprot:9495249-Pyramimonas_sp.AAC.1